ncbi:hypothetical protein EOE48_09565 [Methylobacterium oryzihabitans]|uniref:Uncharacterized protein n=1 Tax=Methylobacterium oryzihabitans TaxID=2499852 RepID=A0A3S2VRH0_9HYPH|nr:hypothetical protein EOE48_09565 [Methylobacterium oryzihabitans]
MTVNTSYEKKGSLMLHCESPSRRQVGRKRRWAEDMSARFPEGTFARIAAVVREDEDRTDFVRAAVEAELERREAAAQGPSPDARSSGGNPDASGPSR